ncbi:tRNA (guanine(10)-N(2))-methyltransferase [Entamoeba marina]
MRVLIRFVESHPNFRFGEFESLLRMFNVKCVYDPNTLDNVFMYAEFESLKDIELICSQAKTYEELVPIVYSKTEELTPLYKDKSFRLKVTCFGRRYKNADQIKIFDKFKDFKLYDYLGKVDLKHPELTIAILENVGRNKTMDDPPKNIYFGCGLCKGNRKIVNHFSLKVRPYIGTTSMDPELCVIMTTMGCCKEATFMCDPFAGTGSMLVTAAHFGSYILGADISNPTLRGKEYYIKTGKPLKNIETNIKYYHIEDKYVGLIVNDFAISALQMRPIFDCIVTDPPYGIRAGAKKIGKKTPDIEPKPVVWGDDYHQHIPQRVKYGVNEVLHDLLLFAAQTLIVGGRLVFWLPTLLPKDAGKDFPSEVMGCLELSANSLQTICTKWGRRLITLTKVRAFDGKLDHTTEWEKI